MGFIFDFLGSIFGYILWFFFDAVSNYGIAIVLFTLVINIILFPLAIKRQKSAARNAKLSLKQQELLKKCGNDKKKYNEELALLYEKEGTTPMSGCFSTLVIPLILWSGVIGAVTKPLQNTLHIENSKVNAATNMLSTIPGVGTTFSSGYEQLQIVKLFSKLDGHLTMFNEKELSDIREFSSGFNFMGLNLLDRPNAEPLSSGLIIIPLLCFLSSALAFYVTQKVSGSLNQMQGCMKFAPYASNLIFAYMGYTVPGAVGLYWIVNSFVNMLQSVILGRYFNIFTINAGDEAARIALLEQKEGAAQKIKEPSQVEALSKRVIPIERGIKRKNKGK